MGGIRPFPIDVAGAAAAPKAVIDGPFSESLRSLPMDLALAQSPSKLNLEHVPGPTGGLGAIRRSEVKRSGTGIPNNALYVGRLE